MGPMVKTVQLISKKTNEQALGKGQNPWWSESFRASKKITPYLIRIVLVNVIIYGL